MDLGNKEIFAKNLQYYMDFYGKDRNDIAKICDVPYSTVASWCNALYYPRIDKIEILANYFNILKSDLVEDKNTLENIKFANSGGLDVSGLDKEEIEEIKKQIEYMRWKKKNGNK